MLNRRLLRIRAMQAIYAYQQCQRSAFQLALDQIANDFLPDLNSMEPQDKNKLAQEREIAEELFKKNYQQKKLVAETSVEPQIARSVLAASRQYHESIERDYDRLARQMVAGAEQVYDAYLYLLKVIIALADQATTALHLQENKRSTTLIVPHEFKLKDNAFVLMLRAHQAFNDECIRRGTSTDPDLMRQWYKLLVKDETFQAYQRMELSDREEDFKIADYIVRNFLLKNDVIVEYLEEENLNWVADKPVLKSMVLKTIKQFQEAAQPEEVSLSPLSINWDDDLEFFKELFTIAINHQRVSEELVAEKTKNWDIDRITVLDKILLMMALGEMMHFPSIPVKVTINEYIELSKIYSTPKSYHFVNGLLNALAEQLTQEGRIRKSGRGLIDNK